VRYISLCSGVEAASMAWLPLDWECVACAEFDDYPSAVLAAKFPDIPNLGDVTKVDWKKYHGAADLVIFGSPCFPAGTLVLTDKKLTPIEDIKPGDMVLTHKNRYRKVLNVGSHVADTVVLKGQGHYGLECTPNHPFYSCEKSRVWNGDEKVYNSLLSDPEWTAASDMRGRMWLNLTGDVGCCDIPPLRLRGDTQDRVLDEAFFYFVGRWLGDGWISQHKRLGRKNSVMKRTFVCCAHDLADFLEERLIETGLTFTRSRERTTTRFACSSQCLYDWMYENFGKSSAGKHLPSWVFSMPVELREALFLGYVDSDGTAVAGGSRTSSVSRELTVGMKMLVSGIGYASSVVRVVNSRSECRIEGRVVKERPYYTQTYYSSSRSAVVSDDGFWGRVRKVLPGHSNVTVYNLEVEEDNSYAADGIAVHNCQSFSVSGLRQGLDDPRGQLMLECLAACRDIDPEWVVFENVPGLLSADKGRCFATFLNAVAILWPDGGAAWRCLDAQWFGVAQRRRRVFAVINTRDWRRAAEVLLDENCLRGNPPTRGETWKDAPANVGRGAEGSGEPRAYGVRTGQTSSNGWGVQEELTHTIGAADKDAVVYDEECLTPWDVQSRRVFTEEAKWPSLYAGEGGGHGYVIRDDEERVNCFKWFAGAKARSMPAYEDGTTPTLTNSDSHQPAVAFAQNQRDEVRLIGGDGDIAGTVQSQVWGNHKNETLICQPKVMASGQANAEVATDMCPTIAARNYKDPPILVTDPIVIDRAAYNQGQNAQYPPHRADRPDGHAGGEVAARDSVLLSNGQDIVGALCARDYKGVGSQFVYEGKVILQVKDGVDGRKRE